MDNLTTTTEVDPGLEVFYDRLLLKRAEPKLLHDKWADRRPLSSKKGKTIKFRRYAALSRATTPLTEGITPNGQKLSKTDLLATVSQYGDFCHITDIVDLVNEDPVLTLATEELGLQMGKTVDWLIKDVLVACASVTTATSGAEIDGSTATLLNKTDIDTVVQTLMGNNADMISSLIRAGTGQGTAPIRPAFMGIAHTDLINDLELVSGFKHTAQYAGQQGIDLAEWGSTGNVRWLVSSVAHDPADDSETYYNLPIIGKHAYGIVDLSGGNAKSIIKAFGSGGTSDPLNQRATAGWKTMFVTRILNDNFMHILKVSNG